MWKLLQVNNIYPQNLKKTLEKKAFDKIVGQEEMLVTSILLFNPLPEDKILDRSKLKQSADDNFKFDENSRKFSKRIENTLDKGEISRYEQFLLCPQCFQKACFPGTSKGVIVWEWVNNCAFYHVKCQ